MELKIGGRTRIVRGLLALTVLSLLTGAALLARTASATPPSGLTSVPVTAGNLPSVVRAKFKDTGGFERGTDVSRIMVMRFAVEPGGSFGWHQHGGPVWAVVNSGMLTFYEVDGGTCQSHLYPAGSAIFDPGDRTHMARNEGSTPVEIYATFMLPAGGAPRVDAPTPGICGS